MNGETPGFLLARAAASVRPASAAPRGAVHRPSVPERTINLTFHGIGEPPTAPGAGRGPGLARSGPVRVGARLGRRARATVRITFDDGNASDVEHALPGAAPARPDRDLLRRRRQARRARLPRRGRRPGARRRRDGDRLPRHAPSPVATARRPRAARGARRREAAARAGRSAARSPRPRARSAPTTAACSRSLRRHGYRRAYTSDRGTARPDDWLQPRNTVRRGDAAGPVERVARRRASPRRACAGARSWRRSGGGDARPSAVRVAPDHRRRRRRGRRVPARAT